MKKLKLYEFNDGIDGVVIAKNFKQAVKMMSKIYHYVPKEIIYDCIDYDKNGLNSKGDWSVKVYAIPKKKGIQSGMIGWLKTI